MGCRSKVIEGNVRFSFQKSVLAVAGLVVQRRLAYYGFFKICGDCREDEERLCGEISRKFGQRVAEAILELLIGKGYKERGAIFSQKRHNSQGCFRDATSRPDNSQLFSRTGPTPFFPVSESGFGMPF